MTKMENNWWRALIFGLLFVIGYKIIDNFPKIVSYFGTVANILMPFIIGGVIAFFMYKPVRKLTALYQKIRVKFFAVHAQTFAIITAYILLLVTAVFVVGHLVDAIYKNIAEIIANWDTISGRAMEIFNGVDIPQKQLILDKINTFLSELLQTEVLLKAGNIVGNVASSVVTVFTGLIVSIYTIVEKESLQSLARTIMHTVFKSTRVGRIRRYATGVAKLFYSYFTGLAIDAVIVGLLSAVFYLIVKAPYPWLLGLIVAIGNMIPFFGPIVAAGIITLACAINMGPLEALWMLLFQIVLGQIDGNLIQPRIVGNSVGISPFWVIFAVLLFGGLWGAPGMLLGVPIVAAIRMVWMNQTEKKAIPQNAETEE